MFLNVQKKKKEERQGGGGGGKKKSFFLITCLEFLAQAVGLVPTHFLFVQSDTLRQLVNGNGANKKRTGSMAAFLRPRSAQEMLCICLSPGLPVLAAPFFLRASFLSQLCAQGSPWWVATLTSP